MSAQNQHIDFDLAAKVLSGEASAEEQKSLDHWAALSDANKRELDSLRQVWEVSAPMEIPALDLDIAWQKIEAQTGEGKVISIDRAEEQTASKRSLRPFLAIAASIALLFSIGLSYWWSQQAPEMLTAFAQNTNMEVALADGSIVTLSPGSKLEYFAESTGTERNVRLEGKGFFDVASDAARPFIVDAAGATVKVLGTKFEIDTDKSPEELTVAVEEGRVQVTSEMLGSHEILHKKQACSLNKASGKLSKSELNAPAAFYWKNRTVKFKRTGLVKASEILAGIFHQPITLDVTQTSNCEITATFENEELEIILEVIASTLHLELVRNENGYTLKGEGC